MKMLKGQEISSGFLQLIFAAVVLIIGVVIFASVFNATGNGTFTEETQAASTNFTQFLVNTPIVPASETATNCTVGETLVINTDYRLNYVDGNFTIINGDLNTSCDIPVTYRIDRIPSDGDFDATSELINDTTNNAFDLVAVALIVLAALIILTVVLLLGRRA